MGNVKNIVEAIAQENTTAPKCTTTSDHVDNDVEAPASLDLSDTETTFESSDNDTLAYETDRELSPSTSMDEEAQTQSENKVEADFPKPFYCGWSQQLMTNPVVHPNGESYEYDIAMEREPDVLYYPNRALKSIIQHEQQRRNEQGTVMGSIRQIDATIWSNVQQLLDQNTSPSSFQVFRPLPDGYYCPITQEIMQDPIVDPDGNTFEYETLLEWISRNQTSPTTRNPYKPTSEKSSISNEETDKDGRNISGHCLFYRNKALTELLELEMSKPEDAIHPMIRTWRDEVVVVGTTGSTCDGSIEITKNGTSPIPIPILSESARLATSSQPSEQVRYDQEHLRPDRCGQLIVILVLLSFLFWYILPHVICYCVSAFLIVLGFGKGWFGRIRERQAERQNGS